MASLVLVSYLAESTVDALCHVDIISRGSSRAILTLLGLDGDRLRWADCFAELASNAALFARGVAAEGVLATESAGERALPRRKRHKRKKKQ